MTFAVAAAGTGGHVFPGLAVAEALVARGVPPDDIAFLGGDRLEARAVPAAGFPFIRLELQGLRRTASPSNLAIPWKVLKAARKTARVLEERRVGVVLAMGGYVTGPAALAAWRSRVPLVVHEQNAVPGLANRLAARRAARVLVAFPTAATRLPGAEVVGNPLRAALTGTPIGAARARARYGLGPGGAVVGVMGGSLGAGVLNRAAAALIESGGGPARGPHPPRDHAAGVQRSAAGAAVPWRVIPFEDEMQYFYAASDLVVARAGALTVSELAATGKPAVLVPYVHGTASHQHANAATLVEAGGAVLVEQDRIAGLPSVVAGLLAEPGRLAAMARAATAVGLPHAAGRVAERLLEVHRG